MVRKTCRFLVFVGVFLFGWSGGQQPVDDGTTTLRASSLEKESEMPQRLPAATEGEDLKFRLQGLGYFN
jgi:hypothetical protein